MKKVVFSVGIMITGMLLCIVALMINQTTGASILPDILIAMGLILSLLGIVIGVIGLTKKRLNMPIISIWHIED